MPDPRRIIVGVEDAAESRAALRWAAAEASARDVELWLVHAYTPSAPLGWHTVPPLDPGTATAEAAERMLADIESEQIPPELGVQTRRVVAEGLAAEVLTRLSDGADLLVVGGKRRLGVREAVLGSVARAVARRAHCPVTVVHAGDLDESPPVRGGQRLRA